MVRAKGVFRTMAVERICPFCDERLPSRRTFRRHLTVTHPGMAHKSGKLASAWVTGVKRRVQYDSRKAKP